MNTNNFQVGGIIQKVGEAFPKFKWKVLVFAYRKKREKRKREKKGRRYI